MNVDDVFPRRDLPGAAEKWGREVETRIIGLESAVLGQRGNLQSENRSSASTLQELSRQIVQLKENQDELDAAVRAIPKPALSQNTSSSFTLGSGWNTVVSTSLTVPAGASLVRLLVIGSGQIVTDTTTQNVETSYRLNVPGIGDSPSAPGPWAVGYGDFRTVLLPSYGWIANVTPGQTITANFQVSAEDPGAYSSPNENSYAVITIDATFTG